MNNYQMLVEDITTRLLEDATYAFNPKEVKRLSTPEYKSREKMISMEISHFLFLAAPLEQESSFSRENISNVLDKGETLSDIPYLKITTDAKGKSKVFGHEGRHRALELQRRGHTHMPVRLISVKPVEIRWSEQGDSSNKYDFIEKWPTKLETEEGGWKVPFPISREDATKPYVPLGEPIKKS